MRRVFLTADLGFGDAGKGTIVDFLTRAYTAHTVVRYNGGAQAGHRVVTADTPAREHVFAQFGSGTFAGAETYLSRFMLLDPLAMIEEEKHLCVLGVSDAFQRTAIDAHALVITPFQRAANRLRELSRDAGRHGSCGMGVGETMDDYLQHGGQVVVVGDLAHPARLREKLAFVRAVNLAKVQTFRATLPDSVQAQAELAILCDPAATDWLLDAYDEFAQRACIVSDEHLAAVLRRAGTVVFEGAQGVLLDEWHGFHPHTTWSTITFAYADALLKQAGYAGQTTRVGITRAYATRHGPGPLVTEDAELTRLLPDARNGFSSWQRGFRVGWLDLVLLRYAVEVLGALDYLAVTCVDRLSALPALHVCQSYAYDTFLVDRIARSSTLHDLAYQARITEHLMRCRPVLEPMADPDMLLAVLGDSLGVPVGLVSAGPTADDKRFLNR